MALMKSKLAGLMLILVLLTGCHSVRQSRAPLGPGLTMLTYNVNWGAPGADLTAEIIRNSGADIVCLQETTPQWARYLQATLSREYPHMGFRDSVGRMGGGLAFLSKSPGRQVACVPSETGWFDGWIMAFDTALGPVQVLNVHLRPPVGRNGSWNLSGYFCTGGDRLEEVQRFWAKRDPGLPMLVAGDFNDTEDSAAVDWLKDQGMTLVLSQFDRRSPTWHWRMGLITLRRRMDHVLCSRELQPCADQVLKTGASDHYPVTATFEKSAPQENQTRSKL